MTKTPWQKVHAKLGIKPVELARLMGRHRSKISRNLRDERGLISGRDQVVLLDIARDLEVELSLEDLTPEAHG